MEAKQTYENCDRIHNAKPGEEQPLQSSVLNVDVAEHLGDQEQELVEMVKGQMKIYLTEEMANQNSWTQDELRNNQNETDKKMQQIQDALSDKKNDSNTFQMALKAEVEQLTETSRRQNLENLTLMKGLTKTMQVLKDNDQFFKENDINTKDVLGNMVDYFNQINKLLTFNTVDGNDGKGISIEGNKDFSAAFLTGMNSKSMLSNNKDANFAAEKEKTVMKNANEALKRLKISLFRTT